MSPSGRLVLARRPQARERGNPELSCVPRKCTASPGHLTAHLHRGCHLLPLLLPGIHSGGVVSAGVQEDDALLWDFLNVMGQGMRDWQHPGTLLRWRGEAQPGCALQGSQPPLSTSPIPHLTSLLPAVKGNSQKCRPWLQRSRGCRFWGRSSGKPGAASPHRGRWACDCPRRVWVGTRRGWT